MEEEQREEGARVLGLSRGMQYMVGSALCFSVMSVCVKLAGRTMASQQIVLARAAIALVLSVWALKRLGISMWGARRNRRLLVARGVFGFVALTCFFWAVTVLPLGDATVIQYTNPVFVALLAAVFLKERVGGAQLLGLVASLVGVVMIAQPSVLFGGPARLDPVAVGVALVGAAVAACSYTVVRALSGKEHPMVVVFYFPLIATPLAIPTAWPVLSWPDATGWALLLAVGVSTQTAQILMTRGLHLERAGPATAITYLQIVFAFVWGVIIFGETPTGWSLAGSVLVVGASLGVAWRGRRG